MKLYIIILCRFILKILYVLPVKKNRILFSSYNGSQYSCNPKYIYRELKERYPQYFDIIWVLKDDSHAVDGRIVKMYSCKFLYMAMTSKVLITNTAFPAYIPFRKKQIIINTWHGGGAYKKVGLDTNPTKAEIHIQKIVAKHTNIFLSTNTRFTNVMSFAEILPLKCFWQIGMPRNDILLRDHAEIRKKVFQKLQIDEHVKLAIYAPTYRGNTSRQVIVNNSLDPVNCSHALKVRWPGEWVLGIRAHHSIAENFKQSDLCLNLTNYPDMQMLLCAADILITDYSSCMWDFSLTGRPCFILACDLDEYTAERSFYTPVEEWPFPICRSNEELAHKIHEFNLDHYREDVKKHHEKLGISESGHAAELVAEAIYQMSIKKIPKDRVIGS